MKLPFETTDTPSARARSSGSTHLCLLLAAALAMLPWVFAPGSPDPFRSVALHPVGKNTPIAATGTDTARAGIGEADLPAVRTVGEATAASAGRERGAAAVSPNVQLAVSAE